MQAQRAKVQWVRDGEAQVDRGQGGQEGGSPGVLQVWARSVKGSHWMLRWGLLWFEGL